MIKQVFFSFILTLFLVSFSLGQNEVPFYSIGQKISVGNAYLTILGTQKSTKSFSDDYIPAKGNILIAVSIEFETTNASSAIESFQSSQITGKNGIYFPTSYGVKKPILEDFSSALQKTQFWQTFEIPSKETNLIYLYQTADFKLISFTLNSQSKYKISKPPIIWDKDNEPIVISRAEIRPKKKTILKQKATAKITKKADVKTASASRVNTVQPKPTAKKTQIVETLAEEPIAVAPSNGIYKVGQRIPSGNFILSLTDWEMKKSSYIETYQVPSGKFMVAIKLKVECLDEKICDSLSLFYFAHLSGRIGNYSSSEYGQKLPDLLRKAISRTIKRGDSIWYERIGWLTFEVSETDNNFVFSYRGSKEFKILLNNSNEPIESNKPILSIKSNSASNAVPSSTNANVIVRPNINANVKIVPPNANTVVITPENLLPANTAKPTKPIKGKPPIKVVPTPQPEKPAETPKTDIPPTSTKTTPSEKVEDSSIQLTKNESGKSTVPVLPKLGKTVSVPPVIGRIFKARYKDWENETIRGTLEFDDDKKQLVFRNKNGKVTQQFDYSDIKLSNPSMNSSTSTTGSVISGIPLPGISVLGENLRKKNFYLTISFFVNNDRSNLEIKIFQLESFESTNAIVKMINERIKPNPK